MAFQIQRLDGSIDGLGDAVAFDTEADAWAAAEAAFGSDPASDGPLGVRAWLKVVETACYAAWWPPAAAIEAIGHSEAECVAHVRDVGGDDCGLEDLEVLRCTERLYREVEAHGGTGLSWAVCRGVADLLGTPR